MSETPIVAAEELRVYFPVRRRGGLFRRTEPLKAVDGVTLSVGAGETLGIVGESGCGKTTLARALLRLVPHTGGELRWSGIDPRTLSREALRERRRELQIVFQDPLAALDPRMTAGEIVAEPLRSFFPRMSRPERQARVAETLTRVGLAPVMANRYPHEFSMGQCQRIGIARAIVAEPRLLVCDEPVSALDVSVQAQIVNLLTRLQRDFRLAMIFISHNLSVVRQVSGRILVLHLGHVVEVAERDALFERPAHPYTRALISAVPLPDPRRERSRERAVLRGELPSPLNPPSGCTFRTRCPRATELCAERAPKLEEVAPGHRVACHHWRD
ncbi:MAG: ATP-binding cassette domain-containing protein [SAR324 cluster bacterium]|nr:ATP-binding cassette domain-containing protein [SAR324 cluster bacterium]